MPTKKEEVSGVGAPLEPFKGVTETWKEWDDDELRWVDKKENLFIKINSSFIQQKEQAHETRLKQKGDA